MGVENLWLWFLRDGDFEFYCLLIPVGMAPQSKYWSAYHSFDESSISYPEQLATVFYFTDGRVTIGCERHQNHNKASKGTGFEFDESSVLPFNGDEIPCYFTEGTFLTYGKRGSTWSVTQGYHHSYNAKEKNHVAESTNVQTGHIKEVTCISMRKEIRYAIKWPNIILGKTWQGIAFLSSIGQ